MRNYTKGARSRAAAASTSSSDCIRTLWRHVPIRPELSDAKKLFDRPRASLPPDPWQRFKHGMALFAHQPGDAIASVELPPSSRAELPSFWSMRGRWSDPRERIRRAVVCRIKDRDGSAACSGSATGVAGRGGTGRVVAEPGCTFAIAVSCRGNRACAPRDRNIRHRNDGHAVSAPLIAGAALFRPRQEAAAMIGSARAAPRRGRHG